MVFSKATGYGIRALAYLARHSGERPCGLREIAEAEQIPALYLSKLLSDLRRQRLIRSTKGIHGGYELARRPEEITLWEVFKILEPDPHLDTCILGRDECDLEADCPLHPEWGEMRRELIGFFQSKTILQIAAGAAIAESRRL
ncbi:MAG: Rrf2 family transcriptional regulator [Acidobacteriota bacterium]|nr:MAG: Rrf2 family transcriptional regulator [Acidobacteriota bacterium]